MFTVSKNSKNLLSKKKSSIPKNFKISFLYCLGFLKFSGILKIRKMISLFIIIFFNCYTFKTGDELFLFIHYLQYEKNS